ncbi:MAG: cell division protein FtsB [Flavobacteriales bacterium]|jgi:cell division protein FtsB
MKIIAAFLFIVLLALQYRLWVGEGSLAHVAQLQSLIDIQKSENARLLTENNLLAAEVAALKNGSNAIEAKAREELGLIKKGETFFLILDEPRTSPAK